MTLFPVHDDDDNGDWVNLSNPHIVWDDEQPVSLAWLIADRATVTSAAWRGPRPEPEPKPEPYPPHPNPVPPEGPPTRCFPRPVRRFGRVYTS